MPVADLYVGTYRSGRLVERNPIHTLRNKLDRFQALRFADDDLILCTLDLHDVERLLVGDAQAPTLADRVAMNP